MDREDVFVWEKEPFEAEYQDDDEDKQFEIMCSFLKAESEEEDAPRYISLRPGTVM